MTTAPIIAHRTLAAELKDQLGGDWYDRPGGSGDPSSRRARLTIEGAAEIEVIERRGLYSVTVVVNDWPVVRRHQSPILRMALSACRADYEVTRRQAAEARWPRRLH